MKGYIYITDKVVVNPELKPDESDYTYTHSTGFHKKPILSVKYGRDLKKWEFNNIEVENVEHLRSFMNGPTSAIKINGVLWKWKNAQPCTYKMTGDKAVILTIK